MHRVHKWVSAASVIVLISGCVAYPRPDSPGLWTKIKGIFKSPIEKVEHAQEKEDEAKEVLLARAHEGLYASKKALELDDPEKAVEVAEPFVSTSLNAMDSARGPLLPETKNILDLRVNELTQPDNLEAKAWMERWSASISDAADIKAQWEKEKIARQVDQTKWSVERDEKAKKWENMWFWIWTLAIGYVFIAWVLPIVGKAWKPLAPIATLAQGIIAPGVTLAYRSTKKLAGDLVGGIEEVRKKTLEQFPDAKAAVNGTLREWVTEADGTAAAVDEIRREKGLL